MNGKELFGMVWRKKQHNVGELLAGRVVGEQEELKLIDPHLSSCKDSVTDFAGHEAGHDMSTPIGSGVQV